MGLIQSRMKTVALRAWEQSVHEAWYAEPRTVLASLYPLTGESAAQIYGERVGGMRLMLVSCNAKVCEGMGVCVDVPPEAHPDYRVTGVPEAWRTHTRAYLERIPPSEMRNGQ